MEVSNGIQRQMSEWWWWSKGNKTSDIYSGMAQHRGCHHFH